MLDINLYLINLGFYAAIGSLVICIFLAKEITKLQSNQVKLVSEIAKLTVTKKGVKNE